MFLADLILYIHLYLSCDRASACTEIKVEDKVKAIYFCTKVDMDLPFDEQLFYQDAESVLVINLGKCVES